MAQVVHFHPVGYPCFLDSLLECLFDTLDVFTVALNRVFRLAVCLHDLQTSKEGVRNRNISMRVLFVSVSVNLFFVKIHAIPLQITQFTWPRPFTQAEVHFHCPASVWAASSMMCFVSSRVSSTSRELRALASINALAILPDNHEALRN